VRSRKFVRIILSHDCCNLRLRLGSAGHAWVYYGRSCSVLILCYLTYTILMVSLCLFVYMLTDPRFTLGVGSLGDRISVPEEDWMLCSRR
jgi:hypothetical protein